MAQLPQSTSGTDIYAIFKDYIVPFLVVAATLSLDRLLRHLTDRKLSERRRLSRALNVRRDQKEYRPSFMGGYNDVSWYINPYWVMVEEADCRLLGWSGIGLLRTDFSTRSEGSFRADPIDVALSHKIVLEARKSECWLVFRTRSHDKLIYASIKPVDNESADLFTPLSRKDVKKIRRQYEWID